MDHVVEAFCGISVNDLEKARHFYVETLGLQLVSEEQGLHVALPGGARLFIYQKDDHEPATYTAINFVVDAIDEVVDELKKKGITFEHYDLGKEMVQDDKEILRGLTVHKGPDIAWFKDPSGNILAVMQTK